MNAIILEDEKIARNRLKRLLLDTDFGINIIGEFEATEDLAEFIKTNPDYDVLFLDIHVSDGSSFSLFDKVELNAAVIFTTAYNEYAIDALRKNAVDYLLKPIKPQELINALDRVSKIDKNSKSLLPPSPYKERFLIRIGTKWHSIHTQDIAYIYSQNKISYFVTKENKKVASDHKLNQLITNLDSKSFFRVNRQFIVNRDSIKEISSHSKSRLKLSLEPHIEEEIVVSTETTPKFKEWLS